MLVLAPLTFLSGTFYSLSMPAQPRRSVALSNPVVTQVNGLRWTFHGHSDVDIRISAALALGFVLVCTAVIRRFSGRGIGCEVEGDGSVAES